MRFPLLLDTYGVLLTERKKEILEYYYDDDCSLSEISEITGISRQGVRDSIKKSEEEIYGYEERLGIVKKLRLGAELCEQAIDKVNESSDDTDYKVKADEITAILEKLRILLDSEPYGSAESDGSSDILE